MDHCGAKSAVGWYCPEKMCNLEDGAPLICPLAAVDRTEPFPTRE
jgi:hypothetical protein